jgi:hypothetical protein
VLNDLLVVQQCGTMACMTFRYAVSEDRTRGSWPVSHVEPSACSACIRFYLR